MIIEGIFNGIYSLIELLFSWINLPGFPSELETSINTFINLIFDNMQLINLFVRVETIKVAIPVLIAIINFDKIYKLTMYIVHKIPLSID